MAQLTDLEKVRKRRARRRLARNLFTLAVLGAVVAIGSIVIRELGEMDLSVMYSDLKAEVVGSGSGYPLALPGGRLESLSTAGDTLMLLSDTNLYAYNDSGKQLLNIQHGFSNEVMLPARDRTLLYDNAGNKLTVYSRSAQVFSMTTDHSIYTADISENGNFAVATGSNEHLAKVRVYSRNNGENIYNCYFADRILTSISLADHRDAMVVGCLEVRDGGYLSSISRYQLSIEKELGRADLPGELLLKVDYADNGTVRAVTDQRAVLFDDNLRESAAYSFAGTTLERFLLRPDGGAVLVLGNYAEQKRLEVVLLDSAMREQGRVTIPYKPVDLKADESYVYLASQDALTLLRPDGSEAGTVSVANLHNIEPLGGSLYYATNTTLSRLPLSELTGPKKASSQGSSAVSGQKGSSSSMDAGSEPESSASGAESAASNAKSSIAESDGVKPESAAFESAGEASEPTPSFDSLNYDAIKPREEE